MSHEEIYEPRVPWALTELLAQGPAPLDDRPPRGGDLDLVIVLPAGADTAGAAGLPEELIDELVRGGAEVTLLGWEEAGDGADADVVLAAGWSVAPEVLRLEGVRARAVLATGERPLLGGNGWTDQIDVVAPRWYGGTLDPGADEAYEPQPSHRRDGVLHLHGDDPLTMLIAAEVVARRPQVEVVVTGVRFPIELPFEATAIAGGAAQVAHAFSLATVGLAPPLRGWRPVATAMAACGLAVVTPDTEAARGALDGVATLVADPAAGADAVELLLDDLEVRAEHSRNGVEAVRPWSDVAAAIVARFADEGAAPPPTF